MAKPKFLLLHRGPVDQKPPSPARMQEMFAAFSAWKEHFKENILDMGGKLGPAGRAVTDAGVTDGPFVSPRRSPS